jgi:hypothetical protein
MSEVREQAAPVETPTAPPVPEPTGPGTAVAAQEQLKATEQPPSTILTEKPPTESKPTPEPEAPPPFDPEKITFPEGFVKNDALFGKFSEIAKASNLPLPVAQQLADLYATAAKSISDQNIQAWNTTRASWEAEVRADPEIAKATLRTSQGVLTGLDAVKATIARVFDNPAIAHPKIREALEVSALGSNLAAIVTFYNLARMVSEGGVVEGNGPSPDAGRRATTRPDAAAALYPNNPRGGAA